MSNKKVFQNALSLSQVLSNKILNLFTFATLLQFMTRQKVLNLYRKFFRVTKNLADDSQKQELRDWVKSEFKTKSKITDKVK